MITEVSNLSEHKKGTENAGVENAGVKMRVET